MIPSPGGEEIYDIAEILIKSRNHSTERRELVHQIVASNDGIKHTHVIKLAQELGSMAKRTIEKELKNLEIDNFLESDKNGEEKSNGSRIWFIKPPEFEFEKVQKKKQRILLQV